MEAFVTETNDAMDWIS